MPIIYSNMYCLNCQHAIFTYVVHLQIFEDFFILQINIDDCTCRRYYGSAAVLLRAFRVNVVGKSTLSSPFDKKYTCISVEEGRNILLFKK